MRMKIFFTDAIRYDFERRLSDVNYQGVEMSLTFKSFLLTSKDVSWWRALSDFARMVALLFWGPRRSNSKASGKVFCHDQILVAMYADVTRFRQMILPILRKLSPFQYNIISFSRSVDSKVYDCSGWCNSFYVMRYGTLRSRLAFLMSIFKIARRVQGWFECNKLSPLLLTPVLKEFLYRYMFVDGFDTFLEYLRPSCIVFDYEHFNPWSVMALLARKKGIKTLNLMHAEIYSSYAWVPLLSSEIAVWGELQRKSLLSYGVLTGQIKVCGCPRLNPDINVDAVSVRKRLGLDTSRPIALLATNPIAWEYREKQVRVFAEAIKEVERVQGVVRLHPSEKIDAYSGLATEFSWLKFLDANSWTLEEALRISRVIVNHDSTAGDDALAYGVPVIELDVLPIGLTNGKKLVDEAKCPLARCGSELKNEIARIVHDDAAFELQIEAARPFVHNLFFAFGDQAAANTSNAVKELVS